MHSLGQPYQSDRIHGPQDSSDHVGTKGLDLHPLTALSGGLRQGMPLDKEVSAAEAISEGDDS